MEHGQTDISPLGARSHRATHGRVDLRMLRTHPRGRQPRRNWISDRLGLVLQPHRGQLSSELVLRHLCPAIEQRLEHRQWVRQLPDGSNILCCPEDIRCRTCTPQSSTLCPRCRVPLCRTCLTRMTQRRAPGVPQALTNDNWLGYPTELLYRHRVRWVEAAAACPVWTSVVCFYLEQDRGHLLEEDIHKAEHRVAIRGNVSSFSMPWEDIMATLDPTHQGHRTWESLPHSPATLQALVKITVKGTRYNEALEWVSGAKIRPWVVIALLQHLVDLGHPICQDRDSPDQDKVRIAERVET